MSRNGKFGQTENRSVIACNWRGKGDDCKQTQRKFDTGNNLIYNVK